MTPQDDPTADLFASRSVAVHVVRGVLGLAVLVTALILARWSAAWLLLTPLTIILWRGCPTCWTMGLLATIGRERANCDRGCPVPR